MESYWINLFRNGRKIGKVRIPSSVGGKRGMMFDQEGIAKPVPHDVTNQNHLDLLPGTYLELPVTISISCHARGPSEKHRFFWADVELTSAEKKEIKKAKAIKKAIAAEKKKTTSRKKS